METQTSSLIGIGFKILNSVATTSSMVATTLQEVNFWSVAHTTTKSSQAAALQERLPVV